MASTLVSLCRDPGHFIALGFGSGLSPRAPGTAGSLIAALVASAATGWPPGACIAFVAVFSLAAIPLCGRTARALGVHDHPAIVADEFAGLWLALVVAGSVTPAGIALAFAWFRVFDIAKPWPIGVLDRRLTGGLGIVADDLAAGVAAGLAVRVTLALTGAPGS